jgi:hypothetical protein
LRNVWIAACAAFVAFDLGRNDGKYMDFAPWKPAVRSDPIVQFFQDDPSQFRVLVLGGHTHGYLNHLHCFLGYWHNLKFAEPPAMSRLAPELASLFQTLSGEANHRFSPRYYDLFNVKYVLVPGKLPDALAAQARLDLARAFPFQQMAPVCVYRYRDFTPNPAFAPRAVSAANEAAVLEKLADPTFDLSRAVVGVSIPETTSDLPALREQAGATGNATLETFDRAAIRVRSVSSGPGWIVLKEKYSPDWRVELDGKPAIAYRVNHLHMGVPVPAGEHSVRLVFSPSRRNFSISLISWIVVALALCAIPLFRTLKRGRPVATASSPPRRRPPFASFCSLPLGH